MSKEEKNQASDQEFAFSKYAVKKDLSCADSDFSPLDLDLKNYHVDYDADQTTPARQTEVLKGEEGSAKNGQIDISDLKLMREQLNKILELPEYGSKQQKDETTLASGLGDMSLFKGIPDPRLASSEDIPLVQENESFSSGKHFSKSNPFFSHDLKELPSNLSEEWTSSDAELLARSYENFEIPSQLYYSNKKEGSCQTSPRNILKSPSSRTSPLYKNQENAELIADQKWLSQSGYSDGTKTKGPLKTPAQSSGSGETTKEQLELFWQRMNLVLRDMALQSKAQTKQLLDSHSDEFISHYEKLEQQISVVENLLRRVQTFIEKSGSKSEKSSHDSQQIKDQDLKTVLFSIDHDLSRTFGFKQAKTLHQKQIFDLNQEMLSERDHLASSYSQQVAAQLENMQKILLRLLDRLEVPASLNPRPTSSSPALKKKSLFPQRKGLLSNFNFSLRKKSHPSKSINTPSSLKFGDFSNVSRFTKSSDFSFQKNASLTIIALVFVIALSSVSLIMNSYKPSTSSELLSPQTETSSEKSMSRFYSSDHSQLSFMTKSAPKHFFHQDESNGSTLLPSVSDEFFGMPIVSSSHF